MKTEKALLIDGRVLDAMTHMAQEMSAKFEDLLSDYPAPVALAVGWRAIGYWIDDAAGCAAAAEQLVQAMIDREKALREENPDTDARVPVCTVAAPGGVQ